MKTKRIVVKIGTSVLTKDTETLDREMIGVISDTIHLLREKGVETVLVSSGAAAGGAEILGEKNSDIGRDARAAVGQVQLMETYKNAFSKHKTTVGQVLLTRADFRNRNRYENARSTLTGLLEHGIVPIINENDAVTTHELSFGDNDSLAAYTAIALEASQLFLMTNQKGLLDDNPSVNPDAKLIEQVIDVEEIYKSLPKNQSSSLGLGGIISKVKAAKIASSAGIETWIANGFEIKNILEILDGEKIGTRFVPQDSSPAPRERWMLCANSADARLSIDQGAAKALRDRKSLLVVGVKKVSGTFNARDIVEILTTDGNIVGYGVSNYNAEEIQNAVSKEQKLEREVIHTNNLRLV